ncbi:TetR family transcriptional regulator [Gordonia terrae]|uniref:acyl-CoA-like ligand-binding transcription factor n=1 Tax=Gordonia terrae TaxID=2055 RepID=UPI00054FCFA4|nr:TetR family transcriptional regulator [Gordonia terrae]
METRRRPPGRPPAASKEDVEQAAVALMIDRGYENVSVEDIAAAAGIGRTTFFRYFGSKSGVIWLEFDATIERLADVLEASADADDVLGSVRTAVLESTRLAVFSSDVWLERFQLLDTTPDLHAGAQARWEQWRLPIESFVANRAADHVDHYVPMVVAAACHAVFVAELRHWRNRDSERIDLLTRLDAHLGNVLSHLDGLFG